MLRVFSPAFKPALQQIFLLQKVDSSSIYFLLQNLYTLHVLPAQRNLVLQQAT